MRRLKLILIIVLSTVLVITIAGGIFVLTLNVKSKRIGNVDIEVKNDQDGEIEIGKEYTALTYNIGFGAYDRDYSFFMDEGVMNDGTKTKGKYGKAVSKENVLKNTNGSIEILKSVNADFMMLEEVDTKSTRSYKVNQYEMITSTFNNYSISYASNFHSGYLPYPLNDMHGTVNSGLLTMSRFNMKESKRIELPVETKFPTKFFDLDRCLNLTRYKVGEKDLVMITAHLSAYDEGGVYRQKQLLLLNELMSEEYSKGNYVIVGGDFNHDLVNSYERGLFKSEQQLPEWLQILNNDDLTSGFSIIADDTSPSCRDADIPYEQGVVFTSVVDGFIVSNNIDVKSVNNIVNLNGDDISFMYSDHNASVLKFCLK